VIHSLILEPLSKQPIRSVETSLYCSFFLGKKGHEVLVQGGVIEDLAKQLVGHYGIPKEFLPFSCL